jgi:thiol-disulfide isomerase/thioredoxin
MPKLHYSIFLLFLLIATQSSLAKEIILKGNNPDYNGQTIDLLVFKNNITNNERKVATTKVDENGNFEWKFTSDQTEYVFSHLGVYQIYLYAEPGNTYQVKLPPFTPKKQDEKLNPFFEEVQLHLLILSIKDPSLQNIPEPTKELNFLIRSFDELYNPLITKYAIRTYTYPELQGLDSSVNVLKKQFDSINHPYFHQYYFYRMGLFKFTSARLKSRIVSDEWFSNKPVLYANPAYMELFNQVYDKYFVFFGRTRLGKKIYTDINSKSSLIELKATLAQDNVLINDTLKEMVILKGIHDGFYEMEFSRGGLLKILDSLTLSTKIDLHKKIGQDIRFKVTKLLVGFKPPAFQLYDKNNQLKSLDNFKGSYVYINFCTTQNYACLKELEQLKRIQEKYGKYVTIVSISLDESLDDMRNYVNRKGYKWTFLHYGNQPDIIKEYDLRALPTYYLLDREGKLVWSPAPTPTENFDVKLFEELRSKRIL